MPTFLSRFGKPSPNSSFIEHPQDSTRLSSSSITQGSKSRSVSPAPSPRPSVTDLPSDVAPPPKLVLNDNEIETVISPVSMHRPESGSTFQWNYEEEKKKRQAHTRAATTGSEIKHEFPTPTPQRVDLPSERSGTLFNNSSAGTSPRDSTASISTQSPSERRGSVTSASSVEGVLFQNMLPIVESPTQMFDKDHPVRARAASSYTPPTESLLPKPDPSDNSAASLRAPNPKVEKKKSWRRPSASSAATLAKPPPPRQMSGLASALAASGMAMANPASTTNPFGTFANNQSLASLSPKSVVTRKGSDRSMRSSVLSIPSTQERTQASTSPISGRRARAASGSTAPGNGSDDEDDSYDSADGLSINGEDIPITGFAVASSKRNSDFHELFPDVAEGDYLIEDYGCALQREILIQGRLYISENHVCFHANIFGWVTDLVLPFSEITVLEKKMTAFVIPNAIQVCTAQAKHTFASFLSRDTTFDVMHNIWRLTRPEGDDGSRRGSLDEANGESDAKLAVGADGRQGKARQATLCACGKAGQHAPQLALECVLPGTPEQIYNLMFASAFIKEFMSGEQHLTEIQISDWIPSTTDGRLLSRNMSYIKPLSGGFGPKQTKCEIKDETLHLDFDNYVSTMTTTRNPDVPSGNAFSVKTRTCIMWAGRGSTRILVTCEVEWSARSFIKSIIEKASYDGTRTYHMDLERAMRAYIQEHRTEFLPEGVDADAADREADAEEALVSPTSPTGVSIDTNRDPRKELDQRGLQWALDTFTATSKVARDSFTGAIELLADAFTDAWQTSSTTAILAVVVGILLVSNLWTLRLVGQREEAGRRKALERRDAERDRWVEEAVQSFIRVQQGVQNAATPPVTEDPHIPLTAEEVGADPLKNLLNRHEELVAITKATEELETRIARLRASLQELD